MGINKEKEDIARLRKQYPDLDIVEVAYDKNGKIIAWAVRDIPPSLTFDSSLWYGANDGC